MKERPILFSGPMVRAIQERTKTQTRRVLKPQLNKWQYVDGCLFYGFDGYHRNVSCSAVGPFKDEACAKAYFAQKHCPYGVPGDRLWVRETWSPMWETDCDNCDGDPQLLDGNGHCKHFYVEYRADTGNKRPGDWPDPEPNGDFGDAPAWKPSIHMFRWASRILLEVTEVRVERVQEITEEGAIAEGVQVNPNAPASLTDRSAFGKLWDSLNAKRGEKIKIGDPWDGWIWGTSPSDDPEALALDIGAPGEIRWRNLADHDEAEWMRFADSQPTGKGMYDVIWEKGDELMRVYLEKCPEEEGVDYNLLKFDWDSNPWVWVIGFKLLEVKT